MTAIQRKVIASATVAVAAVVIARPWIQGVGNRLIRFVSGQHLVGAPLPGRSRENLPTVAVESGNRLCCRMLYCDFRFPLPAGSRVASIEPLTGGFDTIKGTIYVTNVDRGAVDLRAYARAMSKDGFKVDGDSTMLSASSPDGGWVGAEAEGRCSIAFSFFGDY